MAMAPTTRTSHSHHPAYFAVMRVDEATLRRLNAPLPLLPLPPPSSLHQSLAGAAGAALRDALAAGRKVAVPIAAFALMGCCCLVGGGLLVFAAAAAGGPSPSTPPMLGTITNGGGLLAEADAKGLGFLLAMASLLAWGAWLHGYVAQKRQALRQYQHQQQQHGLGVRSPGPMGA